jgi:phenylalanyl-tRNA synthetase beta chain
MLIITAGDVPVGIAGVKGGMAAGIDETTTDIVLESANFSGVSVRKTAQQLKLRTDASQRFEQTITPELAAYGMRAVVDLIVKIAGGAIVGFVDVYPEKQGTTTIEVSLEKINAVLGTNLSGADVADVFRRLRFDCTQDGERFVVTVPFERLDLAIPEDLIEEVGRIIGYSTIPAVELPPAQKKPEINQNFAAAESVRKQLTDLGYSELFTSVFAEKGEREVLNKVGGEKPFLRTTLVDGLNEALGKNYFNRDFLGLKEIKLFEIGMVWKDGKEVMMAGIAEANSSSQTGTAKEDPLSMYVKETSEYERLPYSTTERYQSFSRYPSITRDIALWVHADAQSEEVKDVIAKSAGSLMARIDQFDEFKKGDKTSYAFRLVFQSNEKTLTDDEANSAMNAVYEVVKAKGWEAR